MSPAEIAARLNSPSGETLEAPRPAGTRAGLKAAVHRHAALSREGLAERLFTAVFSGLVYAQIWEDPVLDMEAMELGAGHRLIAIASGGCNVMSYLTADPARIVAVDLNHNHVALNRLKIAGARHLPDHAAFHRFFAEADSSANLAAYDTFLAPNLDAATRAYWEARDWRGRRRVSWFARNVYRFGLLGRFIAAGHLLARLHGVDLARLMAAGGLEEQRAIYDREIRPLQESRLVRFLARRPASLYGLGIPPAQYAALAGDAPGGIMDALFRRLERLACDFPFRDNYFARQAFGRAYKAGPGGALPPYLETENFEAVRDRAQRIDVRHANLIDVLAAEPDASLDRYVLLDAQDWMTDEVLTRLWTEITRTAAPGARVLFRTAAEPTLLTGRLPAPLLARWDYDPDEARALTTRDRSAIYGGVHLYRFRGRA